MIAPTPPEIVCPPLAPASSFDLDWLPQWFHAATPVPLAQSWEPAPVPGFAPAVVRTGWRDEELFVFAELTDADVTTGATSHGQRFWELGDTFEMFFRPANQDAYVEFHVTPNNWRLHLRFPDAAWRVSPARIDPFAEARVHDDRFRSWTWTHGRPGQWSVLAAIPAAAVLDRAQPLAGSTWSFSFSRYDYTRGTAAPVLSSSSPHPVAAFHRQDEWGQLRFGPPAAGPHRPRGAR